MKQPSRSEIAFHEAGHAVAFARFDDAGSVTIVANRDGSALGHVIHAAGFDRMAQNADSPKEKRDRARYIIATLAGYAAQVRYNNGGLKWARICSAGDFADQELLTAVRSLNKPLQHWEQTTMTWVSKAQNWNAITCIATELLERNSLSPLEVESLVHLADNPLDPVWREWLNSARNDDA